MKDNRMSNGDIAHFCKGVSLLLHAGIGLGDGLYFMSEEESGESAEMLKEMGKEVDFGSALWQAMEKHAKFPAYVTGMVKVGEYTGHLEEALMALSFYYEERERMNKQMRSTLTYPAILLLLMLVVIGVLLISVRPVFDEVYASLGGNLNGIAGLLLRFGQFLKAALPVLAVLLALGVGLVLYVCYHAEAREKAVNAFQQKYGDKGVFRKLNDAHFVQALELGYRSGLQVEEAAALAGELLEDVPEAAARYKQCAELLTEGKVLSEALGMTGILQPKECRMLELGMRSGSGEQVIREIAERISEDASMELEAVAGKIEPAMVLSASLLVGMILLAVMLPLMNIMSAIG